MSHLEAACRNALKTGHRIAARRFIAGLVLCFLLKTNVTAFAYSAADAKAVVSSFHSAFYSVTGTNGYFKDTQTGGPAYFWGQAEMIECVIDAYEWTGDPVYRAMTTNLLNGFIKNNGSAWTSWNIYNDDIMWAVIAFARGGMDASNTNYCNLARANFDACYARAWDGKLGGGSIGAPIIRRRMPAPMGPPPSLPICFIKCMATRII